MATSLEGTKSPIIVSGVTHNEDKFALEIKTVSYYDQYLKKLLKQNNTSEVSLIDSYEVARESPISEDPSDEVLDHILNQCRFSVNTLLPLFVGYQTKRNWKLEKNQYPSFIFTETSNRKIDLDMFKEVYGIVNIRDYYTSESSSLLGVYGIADTPILVPVEISHNNVKVSKILLISRCMK